MKRFARIAVCLAGGLALNASLHAVTLVSTNNPLPDNPYAGIVVRNIFGLVPPPPPPDPNAEAAKSLPKITPTGIQSLFGHLEVIFKVSGAPAKPGQPAKDESYILSQGERQDDIEVTKIDEPNSIVTFNNHGTTQELPLTTSGSSGGSASSPGPVQTNPGMAPVQAGGNNNPAGPLAFGGPLNFGKPAGSGGNSGFNNGAAGFNNGANNGVALNFGSPTDPSRIYQPEVSPLDKAATQIAIAGNHLQAIVNHDPTAPFYPPTSLDQAAGIPSTSADGGSSPAR